MTYYFAKLPTNFIVLFFVFLGTLVSYNTIKYGSFVLRNNHYKTSLKIIVFITIISFFICFFLFFKLSNLARLATVFFGFLSLLYLIPFGKHNVNLRNLAGIKIYIVSFCWAGVTILLPLLNANEQIEIDIFFKFLQRFILTLILILIFEINDLKYDDVRLKTVPQTIGIKNTKNVVYLLLVFFYCLEFFKRNLYPNQWLVNLVLVFVTFLFCFFASDKRSKYYTLFWVESIPIIWYLLILIF